MPIFHVWRSPSKPYRYFSFEVDEIRGTVQSTDIYHKLLLCGYTRYFEHQVPAEEYAEYHKSEAKLSDLPLAGSLSHLGTRRPVCSISGGKDSAAMSLFLTELGIEHDRVFMDTGWEHASTYEYIAGALSKHIGPITTIKSGVYPGGMRDAILRKGMFPSRVRRFCTEELKVKPIVAYLNNQVATHPGVDFVNCVGIRRAESESRARMKEWEWSEGLDCEVWRSIINWSEQQVIDIHKKHGLPPNPLYLNGSTRVGCWPCFHARKAEIRHIADVDPGRIELIRQLERDVAVRLGNPPNPPTFFQTPWRTEDGTRPCMPIDEYIKWSRSNITGRDYVEEEAGCVRWGFCGS